MKTEYDISTKEEKEVSYIDFVDTILDKLGFNKANNGTRLLREFIIYLYIKNPLEIKIKDEINAFIKDKKIKISYGNFKERVKYAILNADNKKMQEHFYEVFRIDYDYYFLSVKQIITYIVNAMERNKFKKI